MRSVRAALNILIIVGIVASSYFLYLSLTPEGYTGRILWFTYDVHNPRNPAVALIVLVLLLLLLNWRSMVERRKWLRTVGMLAAVIAILVGVLFYLAYRRHNRPPWERPNLVLIVVEGLSSGHLSPNSTSDSVARTVSLSELAEEGWLFEKAYSHCPSALPSLATLFSSLLPHEVGTYSAGDTPHFSAPTLAQILREEGYRTCAFISSGTIDESSGLSPGFDRFQCLSGSGAASVGADLVTDAALSWLEREVGEAERFFIWMNFDDLIASERAREIPGATDALSLQDAVEFTDAEIGRFVAGLRRRGTYRDTILILVSAGALSSRADICAPWPESLRAADLAVPLIIRDPDTDRKGLRIDKLARLIDVAPTALDLLGLHKPADMNGRTLLEYILRNRSDTRVLEAELLWPRASVAALQGDEFLVLNPQVSGPGRFENYALSDPAQSVNLALSATRREQPGAYAQAEELWAECAGALQAANLLGDVTAQVYSPGSGRRPAALLLSHVESLVRRAAGADAGLVVSASAGSEGLSYVTVEVRAGRSATDAEERLAPAVCRALKSGGALFPMRLRMLAGREVHVDQMVFPAVDMRAPALCALIRPLGLMPISQFAAGAHLAFGLIVE